MSTFGWFAVVILPVLGGLIAWAGDVIGYRLGKSRRSLFGLRPRITARLIGVGVGVALPLIGVGAALLGSSEARDAVFHLDELRQRQVDLKAQNQRLEARQQRTMRQAEASEQRARDLRADLYVTRQSLTETHQQVAAANRELGRAQQEVRRAAGNASRLQAVAERLQGLLAGLQRELQAKGVELAEKVNELTTREAAVHRAEADQKAFEDAFTDAVRLINSPVELETGHELVRTIVETGDSLEDTEDRLLKVLFTASRVAEGLGAEPGPNGLALRLIRPLPPDIAPGQELPKQAEILRAFARQLQAGGPGTFVIGVRVARRMYEAERAPVGVELWPARPRALPYVRVFLENQTIYETEMDGSGTRVAIFTQLYNLVTKIVRREAKGSGLLPNPETGEYGAVNFEQLFEAMDAIAAHPGPVLVQVVAAADTYIVDPLLIRIEVGKGAKTTGAQDRSGG